MSDKPGEVDRAPVIDEADPVQRWLLIHWSKARRERDNERARGARAFNVGATIAGHKMAWIKELIAERQHYGELK